MVGEVQAGVWRTAIEIPEEERVTLPVTGLPGYTGVQLVGLKVAGSSMDLVYPDGSYVIVASAADTDVRPGDRVVVYRSQGDLREASIKEVQVEPDGKIALWPRSTSPEHQVPIYLDDPEQGGPEIAYVVVGQFRAEERPPPPLAYLRKKRA